MSPLRRAGVLLHPTSLPGPDGIGDLGDGAHRFVDVEGGDVPYWRDVGTIDSYYEANMELCDVEPELNLYSREWPIWTYQQHVPSAKFVLDEDGRRGAAINSMVAGGCIVSGAYVKQSLLFSRVTVDEGSEIIQAVVLPQAQIGKHCRVEGIESVAGVIDRLKHADQLVARSRHRHGDQRPDGRYDGGP